MHKSTQRDETNAPAVPELLAAGAQVIVQLHANLDDRELEEAANYDETV
jgi:hypothetical protein